ncbi:hypothetical protein ACHAWF_014193 [Thalassiosira exigua]
MIPRSHRPGNPGGSPARIRPVPGAGVVAAAAALAVVVASSLASSHLSSAAALAFVVRDGVRPAARGAGRRRPAGRRPAPSLGMSSVGGGNDENGGDGDGGGDDNPLNEWMRRKDTDGLRSMRERFAEGRLPISYGAVGDETDDGAGNGAGREGRFGPRATGNRAATTAVDAVSTEFSTEEEEETGLSRATNGVPSRPNPYLDVVSRLAPSDLIARFTSTASPRVQDAVRTTVLGLLGGLPQMAFETKTVATGERLASLMFQLQMTGYMFKNAEYRLSLSQSLGRERMLPGSVGTNREGKRIKGKIKVRYGARGDLGKDADETDGKDETDEEGGQPSSSPFSTPGMEVEVDAKAYMSELRGEVRRLREELDARKQAKEEEIRKDLLMYVRTLPPRELQQLTGTMSPEVLEAMKGLVTAVLAGIGEDEEDDNRAAVEGGSGGDPNKIGPDTVTEQSGEALAQLCMWQLVVGFNLRELEVREEMRASMAGLLGEGGDDGGGSGGDVFGPGALE